MAWKKQGQKQALFSAFISAVDFGWPAMLLFDVEASGLTIGLAIKGAISIGVKIATGFLGYSL